jgi:hypothetical protein
MHVFGILVRTQMAMAAWAYFCLLLYSIDLYICFCASTIVLLLLWICSRIWSQYCDTSIIALFELRALHLLGRHSATWAMPPFLLALVIFQVGSHTFAWSQFGLRSSHLCLLRSWNDRHATIPSLLVEMESHYLFCLWWLWTMIFLISASQVTGITCVNHHIQPGTKSYY